MCILVIESKQKLGPSFETGPFFKKKRKIKDEIKQGSVLLAWPSFCLLPWDA